MYFENEILRHSDFKTSEISLEDFYGFRGIKIIDSKSISDADESTITAAREILNGYSKFSNLTGFLRAASSQKEYNLRYRLIPPYTTSRLDSRYLLMLLLRTGFIKDFSYSDISESFYIELNPESRYSVSELIKIGICSLLEELGGEAVYDARMHFFKEKKDVSNDIVYRKGNKICCISVRIAAGLEYDVDSHPEQLKKFIYRLYSGSPDELFVVTPYVKKLFQQNDNIVSIEKVQEYFNKK